MALTPGTRLGVYEVTAQIGEGGMGQVYRATDTTLGRPVAIKILPDAFAADPDHMARFEREAKTLGSLNHPHIAAIYAVEKSAGMHALVMELVEGEDLSQRIARGAILLDEALPIAKQIADALEAAHEQGIIHRDLKPANIKVRPDGTVKVLDFGLAKAMGPTPDSSARVSLSPTITTPAMSQAGMILGTAAYMSPEQARGKPVDKRADLWAFGCVLYEMLTGRPVFPGTDVSEVLAGVIKSDPAWGALPATTPPVIRRLLRRCLDKDPRERLRDIGDARQDLRDALTNPAAEAIAVTMARPGSRWRGVAALTAGALAVAAVGGATVWFTTRPIPPRVARFPLTTASTAALSINGTDRDLAVTPDGSRVVYVGGGGTELLMRPLDQIEPIVVARGLPRGVFVAPDGQWIGFVDNNRTLKKVAITVDRRKP